MIGGEVGVRDPAVTPGLQSLHGKKNWGTGEGWYRMPIPVELHYQTVETRSKILKNAGGFKEMCVETL